MNTRIPADPVGWVSRMPLFLNITPIEARSNPPWTQRVRLPGGLRGAQQSHPGYRPATRAANPPYESDSEPSRMLP